MKIAKLIIRFWPAVGGAEEHALEICKRLSKKHDVTVITSDLESEFPWKKFKKDPGNYGKIKIKRLETKKVSNYPVLKNLWKELEGFDVIHSYALPKYYTDVGAIFAKIHKVKFTVSTVGLHFHETPRKTNFARELLRKILLKAYYNTLGKFVFKTARYIHVFSTHEKNFVMKYGASEDKIKIIGSGIDWKKYQKKRKFDDEGYLLFIGRIDKGKGLNYLVKAIKGTNERLLIIGKDFGYKDELKKLIDKLGLKKQVKFLGYVSEDEKIGAIQHCKALVLPSKYESFGRVIVEAMACGRPVIGSRVGGMIDLINKERGILVEYGDVEGLRKAIKNPRGNGKEFSKRFDWDEIYKETLKMYEK